MNQKILITDDMGLYRHGLKATLTRYFSAFDVIDVASASATLSALEVHADVALVLLDFDLSDRPGFEVLQEIKTLWPCIPVAIFSDEASSELVDETLALGAHGFITKTSRSEVVLSAIQLIMAGEIYIPRLRLQEVIARNYCMHTVTMPTFPNEESHLTPRQREVLRLMVEGYSNKEICSRLNLSMGTIKTHCNAIFRDLNVTNRTQAAQAARRSHLL